MEIHTDVRLTEEETLQLLKHFDDSSDVPLHQSLDFVSYSEKLSLCAHFLLAINDGKYMGFIAYYLNAEGNFVYIPQIVVHKDGRHMGIGHMMMAALQEMCFGKYEKVLLEVLNTNLNARKFYEREGFIEEEKHGERLLLSKSLIEKEK